MVVVGIILGEADKAIGGGVDQPQASSGTDRSVGAGFAPMVGIFIRAESIRPPFSAGQ